MNVFQAVKEAVPTRTAAESYGIEVRRNGMALCPFHDDHEPSLKVDNRYHCFGCNADGDVIDFVGRLFDLSPKQSAEKLGRDLSRVFSAKDANCAKNTYTSHIEQSSKVRTALYVFYSV